MWQFVTRWQVTLAVFHNGFNVYLKSFAQATISLGGTMTHPLYSHCKHGHPFDDENTGRTYRHGKPAERYCKACNRRRALASYYAHK